MREKREMSERCPDSRHIFQTLHVGCFEGPMVKEGLLGATEIVAARQGQIHRHLGSNAEKEEIWSCDTAHRSYITKMQ